MIEMRWLDRVLQEPGYGEPEMRECVLQFREWPAGLRPGGNVEPTWQDIPIVTESYRSQSVERGKG